MNSAKLNKIVLIISIVVIVAGLAALSSKAYHAIRGARAPGIEGAWQGTLQAGPASFRLRFKISANAGGAWRAELDSLDQGVNGIAATSASFDAPIVKLSFNQIGGTFQGDLSADKTQLTGDWTQSGQTFPLKLEREADKKRMEP
jgi:hypothetical protein